MKDGETAEGELAFRLEAAQSGSEKDVKWRRQMNRHKRPPATTVPAIEQPSFL